MKKLLLLLLLSSFCFLASCKDTQVIQSSDTGTIIGKVGLYDEEGFAHDTSLDATVELEGTSFKTTTNVKGEWTLENVPAGVYSVAFSKQGYGTIKNTAFQFVGNGTANFGGMRVLKNPSFTVSLRNISLNDTMSYTIISRDSGRYRDSVLYSTDSSGHRDSLVVHYYDTVYHAPDTIINNWGSFNVFGSISRPNPRKWTDEVVIYCTKNASVTPTDPSTYLYALVYSTGYGGLELSAARLSLEGLRKSGFVKGDNVNMIAFPTNPEASYTGQFYFDVKLRKNIYTALGTASNTISFTMP